MPKSTSLLISLFLFCSGILKAQQTSVGVLLGAENYNMNWRPLLGFTLEHRKTKHSGFEGGVQYRSSQQVFDASVLVGTTLYEYTARVNEHHITLPFLYKYHSRIVNIAAGPTFDFYLGYSAKASDLGVTVNNYSRTPTFGIGGLLKINKAISLTEHIFLEPELRVNPIFNSGSFYQGFAVGAKYKLKTR